MGEFVPFLLKVGTYVLEVGKFVIFTHFLFQIWEQSGYKGEDLPCRKGDLGGERAILSEQGQTGSRSKELNFNGDLTSRLETRVCTRVMI